MKEKSPTPTIVEQEWPYLLSVETIGSKPLRLTIAPDESQKKALCKRMGLHGIQHLSADMVIERNQGNRIIHVTGTLKAEVTQKCVVTLQPVKETITEPFEGWFADPHQAVSFAKAKRERMSPQEQMDQPLLEEHEDPEPIIDGKIDLGEFVAQFFSLSLNPYPRAEGFDYENNEIFKEPEPEGVYDNPFAALKDWKIKEQKKEKP